MTASGAGIGGLLLVLSLQKDAPDVVVNIYESTAELVEVGAGIGFWPRMWEMLTYLGLEDDLLKISGSQDGLGRHHSCKDALLADELSC